MVSRERDKNFAIAVKIASVLVVVGVFASIFISPKLYITSGLVGGLVLLALFLLNMHRHLGRIRVDLQHGWLACARCGYDFRGLVKPTGDLLWNDTESLRKAINEPSDAIACPECGFKSTTAATRKYWYHNTQPRHR